MLEDSIKLAETKSYSAYVRQSKDKNKNINWQRWRTIGVVLAVYISLTIVYLPQVYFGNLVVTNPSPYPFMPYVVGHFLWFWITLLIIRRSEERRVGKECRSRWS